MLPIFKRFAAAFALAIVVNLNAQAQGVRTCGTYQATMDLASQNPEYAKILQNYLESIPAISVNANLRQQQTTKIIPVVVHIIYSNTTSNITDAQVHDAIGFLNKDFNKLNSDTGQVIAAFRPLAAKVGVEFKLAQLDPDGQCTSGITRTFSSMSNSAGENVKGLIRWNPSKYLNVWVVNNIASGAGGYSILPCAPADADGIVIRHNQFGTIGTSSPWGLAARSLTHEVGHYLGLPHTWGHSNTPGLASNCDIDDGIADTPNTTGVSGGGCNTNASTCGGLNNVQNFMDYSNCPKMFTEGQKAVILNALNLSCRSGLWSPSNNVATGTNAGFQVSACLPNAAFSSDGNRICQGGNVYFYDESVDFPGNPSTGRLWTFQGGTPATSTDPEPVIQYATPGVYAVTLEITNAGGTTTLVKNNFVQVINSTNTLQVPVTESFESPDFPVNPADPDMSWEHQNTTTFTWHRTAAAKIHGGHSLRIQNQYIPIGRINSVLTPNINLAGITEPVLKFNLAYALPATNSGNPDILRVNYSTDCGKTWFSLFNKGGAALATTPAVANNFVPSTSQWQEETLQLPTTAPYLMLQFEASSGNSNAIYLDAIRILDNSVSSVEAAVQPEIFSIFPNPAIGNAKISYYLRTDCLTKLVITNALGQKIYHKEILETEGQKEHFLLQDKQQLAPGIYFVTLYNGHKAFAKKIIVN